MTEASKARKAGKQLGVVDLVDVLEPSAPCVSVVIDRVHGAVAGAFTRSAAATAFMKDFGAIKGLQFSDPADGRPQLRTSDGRGLVFEQYEFLAHKAKRTLKIGEEVVIGVGIDSKKPDEYRSPLAVSTLHDGDAFFADMCNHRTFLQG